MSYVLRVARYSAVLAWDGKCRRLTHLSCLPCLGPPESLPSRLQAPHWGHQAHGRFLCAVYLAGLQADMPMALTLQLAFVAASCTASGTKL